MNKAKGDPEVVREPEEEVLSMEGNIVILQFFIEDGFSLK